MSIYEAILKMSREELAEFLFANAGYIDAEYGQGSGADDLTGIWKLLGKDIKGDW